MKKTLLVIAMTASIFAADKPKELSDKQKVAALSAKVAAQAQEIADLQRLAQYYKSLVPANMQLNAVVDSIQKDLGGCIVQNDLTCTPAAPEKKEEKK